MFFELFGQQMHGGRGANIQIAAETEGHGYQV